MNQSLVPGSQGERTGGNGGEQAALLHLLFPSLYGRHCAQRGRSEAMHQTWLSSVSFAPSEWPTWSFVSQR